MRLYVFRVCAKYLFNTIRVDIERIGEYEAGYFVRSVLSITHDYLNVTYSAVFREVRAKLSPDTQMGPVVDGLKSATGR